MQDIAEDSYPGHRGSFSSRTSQKILFQDIAEGNCRRRVHCQVIAGEDSFPGHRRRGFIFRTSGDLYLGRRRRPIYRTSQKRFPEHRRRGLFPGHRGRLHSPGEKRRGIIRAIYQILMRFFFISSCFNHHINSALQRNLIQQKFTNESEE